MPRRQVAIAVLRCSAIVVTFIFVGGLDYLAALTVVVFGRAEAFPESPLTTLLDQTGGMFILLLLAILLTAVGIERCIMIAKAASQSRSYKNRALTALFYGRFDEAASAAALFPKSPVALVVTASLQGTGRESAGLSGPANPSKPAFQRALIAQTIALKRHLWMLEAIGWSSPVIGLVTVLTPPPRGAANPTSALLLSLAIAVPAIWLSRGLASKCDDLLFEAETMSSSILDQMTEQAEARFDNRDAFRHHAAS